MRSVDFSVVGVDHRVTKPTRRKISEYLDGGPMKIKLEREPDNVHDENAIKVILAEKPYKGLHVGYIPRKVAATFSPAMDADALVNLTAWLVTLDAEEGNGSIVVRFSLRKKTKRAGKK